MEEILQSIKRIMDDNTGTEPPAQTDDVFDLTNVVKENESMKEAPAAAPPPENPVKDSAPAPEIPAAPAKKPLETLEEGLMSEDTVSAAATAFRKIANNAVKDYSLPNLPSAEFRNGNTVEALVLEALRPMLKEWLDRNLPLIVQKIVEKEVKRIVTLYSDLT